MEPQSIKAKGVQRNDIYHSIVCPAAKEWTSPLNVLICILNIYIGLMGFIALLNREFGTDTYTLLKINDRIKNF